MKCQGKFKFKSITKRDGGSFTNNQGQVITYKPSFSLKVDEVTEKGIFERQFKIAEDSPLLNVLVNVKPYDDIVLDFDVSFYESGIKIVLVDLIK